MASIPTTSQSQKVHQSIADTHLIITPVSMNSTAMIITITSNCAPVLSSTQKCYTQLKGLCFIVFLCFTMQIVI